MAVHGRVAVPVVVVGTAVIERNEIHPEISRANRRDDARTTSTGGGVVTLSHDLTIAANTGAGGAESRRNGVEHQAPVLRVPLVTARQVREEELLAVLLLRRVSAAHLYLLGHVVHVRVVVAGVAHRARVRGGRRRRHVVVGRRVVVAAATAARPLHVEVEADEDAGDGEDDRQGQCYAQNDDVVAFACG